jgi:hypothetical protein
MAGAGLLLVLLAGLAVWQPWSDSRAPDETSPDLAADIPPLGIDAPSFDAAVFHMAVCIDNDTWLRPSLEEQKAHVEADPRYAPWIGQYAEIFEKSFHVGAGPATGRPNPFGKVYLFAGLWTAGDKSQVYAQLEAGCPEEPNVAHTNVVDVWLLGYEASTAVLNHGRVAIIVAPKPAGFQAVQLRFPGPAAEYAGIIEIQDASGNVIGHAE